MKVTHALCATAVLIGTGSAATAQVLIQIYENASGVSVSGLDLGVELFDGGSTIDMVFFNRSTISATITDLYVENTAFSSTLTNPFISDTMGEVAFVPPANPATPAAFPIAFGGLWQGSLWSAQGTSPQPTWGINPGESLTLTFDLGAATFEQIASALRDPSRFRIVEKIQGLPGGQSVWGVTPTPGSMFLLAMSGLCFCLPRRRGKALA